MRTPISSPSLSRSSTTVAGIPFVGVGIIHNHHHVEETVDDGLGNVEHVDLMFGQVCADACDDADSIPTDDGDDCLVHGTPQTLGANIQLPSRRKCRTCLKYRKGRCQKVVFSAIALHCETISSVENRFQSAESRFLEYLLFDVKSDFIAESACRSFGNTISASALQYDHAIHFSLILSFQEEGEDQHR